MGIVSIQRFNENSVIGLWKITESVEELLYEMNLTSKDQQIFAKKSTVGKKQEWLACRRLLRSMSENAGEIGYDPMGKPFLKDSNLNISISHSGHYACVYLSESRPVGIDVQKLKPSISAGSHFFLNENEFEWVDQDDNAQLHLIWSVKEAVYKFAGKQNLDLKKDIILNPIKSNENDLIEVNILGKVMNDILYVHYRFFDNHVLTWTI
jgi:4'-phosphopantetheinyl transferase